MEDGSVCDHEERCNGKKTDRKIIKMLIILFGSVILFIFSNKNFFFFVMEKLFMVN